MYRVTRNRCLRPDNERTTGRPDHLKHYACAAYRWRRQKITSLHKYQLTRLPSNLRPTTRECVHYTWSLSITWQRWSSHSIRHIRKPHATRKLYGSMFYRIELNCLSKFYIAGIGIFYLFCSCDLDKMTFIYESDTYSLEIHRTCKYELSTSRLSIVIVWQTYMHTRPKLHTTPLGGCSTIAFNSFPYCM